MIEHELNMQELEHPSKHLTDNYRKDKDSNNYKLLDLGHQEHKEIMRILRLVEAWRDMDNAEGFTLDKIGKNVLELRGGRNDHEYRKAIKIKIRGNLSAGTIEDLNDIAAILFDEHFMSVSEAWHQKSYDFEPAAVVLHLRNLYFGWGSAFWRDIEFLNEVMAGGIGLITRHTAERDVGVYSAAGLSVLSREYIICDKTPIPTEVYSCSGTGMSAMSREYIIIDYEPISPDSTEYTATAVSEFRKEEYLE